MSDWIEKERLKEEARGTTRAREVADGKADRTAAAADQVRSINNHSAHLSALRDSLRSQFERLRDYGLLPKNSRITFERDGIPAVGVSCGSPGSMLLIEVNGRGSLEVYLYDGNAHRAKSFPIPAFRLTERRFHTLTKWFLRSIKGQSPWMPMSFVQEVFWTIAIALCILLCFGILKAIPWFVLCGILFAISFSRLIIDHEHDTRASDGMLRREQEYFRGGPPLEDPKTRF
jgi:hypothetical protein